MTVLEWQAKLTRKSALMLAHFVETTEPARLTWQPNADEKSKGRSVLDQVAECCRVNDRFAAILAGKVPPDPPAVEGTPYRGDAKEASKALMESAEALATVIVNLDEEALTRNYDSPFGPTPGAILMEIAVGNMQYHGGQVCYIQTLYGDTEFRVSPHYMSA